MLEVELPVAGQKVTEWEGSDVRTQRGEGEGRGQICGPEMRYSRS
jgi:hypothetical protein